MNILIMMTGGTISTTETPSGHLSANGKATVSLLVKELQKDGFGDITFEYTHPLDILSENMTFPRLGRLIDAFRHVDRSKYDGIIVAHGTDTLAYTSSLLSLTLAGWWDKPVFLVSSDYTLTDSRANGHANFKAAVELIEKGFGAGVYVPYRNSDGIVYLHNGAHLRQCDNFTADFKSADMLPYTEAKPHAIQAEHPIIEQLRKLDECVMLVQPYVGIDYRLIGFKKSIRAVVHGSYHSATACVERSEAGKPYTSRSLLYLRDICKVCGVDLYLSPIPSHMKSTSGTYSTTADLISGGIKPIFSLTNETAYMKLALAYSLGYEGEEAEAFLERPLASEHLD